LAPCESSFSSELKGEENDFKIFWKRSATNEKRRRERQGDREREGRVNRRTDQGDLLLGPSWSRGGGGSPPPKPISGCLDWSEDDDVAGGVEAVV
jgi:hypothetical protein